VFQLDEAPKEGKGSHWAVRIGMGLALVGALWAVQSYAPDKGALPMMMRRASHACHHTPDTASSKSRIRPNVRGCMAARPGG
jgi:hypothetical protein